MLQLFESYLDRKDVGDEARYDKVREGAVVFLGTLARHLDPSDAKVPPPPLFPPPIFLLLPVLVTSLLVPVQSNCTISCLSKTKRMCLSSPEM